MGVIAGYEYRVNGGAAVDVGNTLTAIASALSPNTAYTIQIRSYDSAGNRSAWSGSVGATTANAPILDVISSGTLKAAYGLRKMRTAYAGSAVRVQRSSDSTELNIGFVGDHLDVAAASAFAGAGTLKVVTWYDQTAAGLNATVLAANAPTLKLNATVYGRPEIDWGTTAGNTAIRLVTAASFSLTAPKMFVVHRFQLITSNSMIWNFGAYKFIGRHVGNRINLQNGAAADFGAGTNSLEQNTLWYVSGDDRCFRNGTELTLFAGVANAGDSAITNEPLYIGNDHTLGEGMTGAINEFIIIDGAVSDADRGNIQTSQMNYWDALPVGSAVSLRIDAGRDSGGMIDNFYQDKFRVGISGIDTGAAVVDITGLVNPASADAYRSSRVYTSEAPRYDFTGLVPSKNYKIRCHFSEGNVAHVLGTGNIALQINDVDSIPVGATPLTDNAYFEVFDKAGSLHKGYIREYIAAATAGGVIKVVVTASTSQSAADIKIAAVEILEAPPVASFTVSASTNKGTARTFTDTSSGTPSSWAWDFGDGTTSTVQNPSKTYAVAGTYTVTLIATNSIGASVVYSTTVTVSSSAAITLGPTTLSNADNGTAYSQALAGAGGTAPYTYSRFEDDSRYYEALTAGTLITRKGILPNGLAIGASGITGTPNIPLPSLIVIEGDSLMTDNSAEGATGLFDTPVSPPALLTAILPQSWKVINISTGGETLVNMDSQYAAQAGIHADALYSKGIYFISGGTNDVNGNLSSLAEMQTAVQSAVNKAIASGFMVIAGNIPVYHAWSGATLTKATDYNTWFASASLTGVGQKIDWNALLPNKSNTYYANAGIHRTALGNVKVAARIKTAIDALATNGTGLRNVDYRFTAKVSDVNGDAITRDYTLTVTP